MDLEIRSLNRPNTPLQRYVQSSNDPMGKSRDSNLLKIRGPKSASRNPLHLHQSCPTLGLELPQDPGGNEVAAGNVQRLDEGQTALAVSGDTNGRTSPLPIIASHRFQKLIVTIIVVVSYSISILSHDTVTDDNIDNLKDIQITSEKTSHSYYIP